MPLPQAPEEEPEPPEDPPDEPEFPAELVWTTEPALEPSEMPDDHNGLELPVEGSTGYTSISLPMWRSVEDSAAAQHAVEEWRQAREAARKQREEEEARRLEQARQEAAERQREEERRRQEALASQATAAVDVTTAGQAPVLRPSPQEMLPEPAVPDEAAGGETVPPDSDGAESAEPGPEPSENAAAPEAGSDSAPEPQAAPENAPAEAAPPESAPSPDASAVPPAADESVSEAAPPASEPTPDASTDSAPVPEPAPEPEPEEPGPTLTDGAMAILAAGTPFTILQEVGNWWKIRCETDYTDEDGQPQHGEAIGWVEHRWCMINLPDVIPSILYDATNGYSSKFVSCGKPLAGITGQALYPGKAQNDRLGEPEFMMPVLYSMAFRLCAAQRAALAEGNCLVLYEGYRPLDVQMEVSGALRVLIRDDAEVRAGVTSAPWSIAWFIATSASNHQQGYAVDVSLARVRSVRECQSGNYRYIRVEQSQLYDMPTAIHELSRAAATFTAPVASHSPTAWKSATLAPGMNEPALGLQKYCTNAELTPLASEWWHFNDLNTRSQILGQPGSGGFAITRCRSIAP